MVVGSCTLVAPSRARIPIQVHKSAANISRQMAESVFEEMVSVRTRLALQSPPSRFIETCRAEQGTLTADDESLADSV